MFSSKAGIAPSTPVTSAAEVARKLHSLVSAGLPAAQGWALIQGNLAQVSIQRRNQFERLWEVAVETGGSLGSALNRLASVFNRLESVEAQLKVAFSAPKATSKLIFGLPILGLGLAQLLGLNPLAAMFGSLPGFLALCLGLILMLVARIVSNRMLKRAEPNFEDPGMFLDCVVIGLQAGLPLAASVGNAESKHEFEVQPVALERLEHSAELSNSTGAELSQILLAAADSLRDEFFAMQSGRLAKLSVHLMIPLGLAVLPAFVLLTVVPIAIGLLAK